MATAVAIVEPKDYKYSRGGSRASKGRELLAEPGLKITLGEAEKDGKRVPAYRLEYSGKTHLIFYDGSSWSCNCDDERKRAHGGCKHIWAVYWAIQDGQVPAPEVKGAGKPAGEKEEKKKEVPAAGFIGPQKAQLIGALKLGFNALLKGPTGTGKTVLVKQAARELGYKLGYVAGSESLQDIDFLGAFVKKGSEIAWADGKLSRAFRLAQRYKVILFIDEINRIPSKHLNILIGVMNPNGKYYQLYNHLTGETLEAPVENLRFIGAMNEGGSYQVHPLDPALTRRFQAKIRFNYLPAEQEKALLVARTGISEELAGKMVELANLQREATKRGEYDFSLDTASLLAWAKMVVEGKLPPEEAAECTWMHGLVGSEMDGTPNEEQLEGLRKLMETVF